MEGNSIAVAFLSLFALSISSSQASDPDMLQDLCVAVLSHGTPLWRNGPPEKPVLCNACGSRWRTKGTLVNYTPLHARAEPDDFDEYRLPKVRTVSIKHKEPKLNKRKQSYGNVVVKREAPDYDQNFRRGLEEDTSNRSSSGSAISYSESCAQFGATDANELTGSAQSNVWDTLVPSRKRTCVTRPKQSPVEKLTKDLYSILHEQQSYFSGSSELLFESANPMIEIGHGSILMKHPNAAIREEESEASSFPIDNKANAVNEVYSGSGSLPVHIHSKGVPDVGVGEMKKPVGHGIQQGQAKGYKPCEMLQILQSHNSPIKSIDLKDVVSFDAFVKHFTHEEQLQLMKYLPPVDTARLPDSIKSMFGSAQFAEDLSSFQHLLAEGVFDLSVSERDTEEYKTLKRLALVNLTKSKWVEQHNLLKDLKHKQITGGNGFSVGTNVLGSMSHVMRPCDGPNQNFSGPKAMMKSPKRLEMKAGYDTKDLIDNESSYFCPRSLFAAPPERSSLMLDCFQFTDDSSEQDLLLDIPSNGSFPQAELLYPTTSFGSQQGSTSSSVVYPNHVRR